MSPTASGPGRARLLTFPSAVAHEPAIDRWLAGRPPELGAIAGAWFTRMRRCGPDVRELMHDGCPTACVDDAAFGYVAAFRSHVNVGFFQGASLPDPAGLLQGRGKFMRHVKLRPGAPVDSAALEALVARAYQDMRAWLGRPTMPGPSATPSPPPTST